MVAMAPDRRVEPVPAATSFYATYHKPCSTLRHSGRGKAKLTILVKGKSATDQATATRIFRSVRFQ